MGGYFIVRGIERVIRLLQVGCGCGFDGGRETHVGLACLQHTSCCRFERLGGTGGAENEHRVVVAAPAACLPVKSEDGTGIAESRAFRAPGRAWPPRMAQATNSNKIVEIAAARQGAYLEVHPQRWPGTEGERNSPVRSESRPQKGQGWGVARCSSRDTRTPHTRTRAAHAPQHAQASIPQIHPHHPNLSSKARTRNVNVKWLTFDRSVYPQPRAVAAIPIGSFLSWNGMECRCDTPSQARVRCRCLVTSRG